MNSRNRTQRERGGREKTTHPALIIYLCLVSLKAREILWLSNVFFFSPVFFLSWRDRCTSNMWTSFHINSYYHKRDRDFHFHSHSRSLLQIDFLYFVQKEILPWSIVFHGIIVMAVFVRQENLPAKENDQFNRRTVSLNKVRCDHPVVYCCLCEEDDE